MNEIVWILGAGFSKPLGGPLLRDLLTTSGRHNVRAAFPALANTIDGPRKDVHRVYDRFKYTDEHHPGERLWRDAEEFLDYLDTAALGGPARDRLLQFAELKDYKPDPVKALADGARSMVAAECAAFLVGADPGTERWRSHVHWFESLGPNDTIITFNYDLVLERLDRVAPGRIEVALPGRRLSGRCARVLKLHGSIDWKRTPRAPGKVEFDTAQEGDSFPLVANPDELAVATPGPSKSTRSGELEPLWTAAETAIKQATAVVFVGYRFPPTDAIARLRLLRALAANDRTYLAVHTVLGPRLGEDDTVRMRHLLHSAMQQAARVPANPKQIDHNGRSRCFTVVQHPLWAQDFLGYVAGGQILQANLHFT